MVLIMYDLVLKNSKLIDENNEVYIGINNGKIAKISKSSLNGEKEIDLKGQIVLPGLIDPHVHFRDPGLTYKEDFKTGSMAATGAKTGMMIGIIEKLNGHLKSCFFFVNIQLPIISAQENK